MISPVRRQVVEVEELILTNVKETDAGFEFPSAGVKVLNPLIWNWVGAVHCLGVRADGRAEVSAERPRTTRLEVYMMDVLRDAFFFVEVDEWLTWGMNEKLNLTESSFQAFILLYHGTTCHSSQLCGKVSSDIPSL